MAPTCSPTGRGASLAQADGSQSVWLTEENPLYSPELTGFRPAGSWLTGELEQTLSAEGVVNLTVDAEPHTFVAAGIIVHNREGFCLPGGCTEGHVCGEGSCVPEGGAGGSGAQGGVSGQGAAGGLGGG